MALKKIYLISGAYVISLKASGSYRCMGPTCCERDDIYTRNKKYHLVALVVVVVDVTSGGVGLLFGHKQREEERERERGRIEK